jgi:hypothetical protein
MLVSSFNLSQSFITHLISFAKTVQIRDQLCLCTDLVCAFYHWLTKYEIFHELLCDALWTVHASQMYMYG